MPTPEPGLAALRAEASRYAARAFAPYSGRRQAVLLVLSDGRWVPGVRVESASYSLVIPAVLNAVSTAAAAGRTDVVAVVADHDLAPAERAYLDALPHGPFAPAGEGVWTSTTAPCPAPGDRLEAFLEGDVPAGPADGIALAREVAGRAVVPESDFPVGCVLVTADGRLVPGVNVEHPDWSRILCAERNALGTVVSYGGAETAALYLTCLKDDGGTPCGACRQLLVELASEAALWMDRGDAPPEETTPAALLPGFFSGRALLAPDAAARPPAPLPQPPSPPRRPR